MAKLENARAPKAPKAPKAAKADKPATGTGTTELPPGAAAAEATDVALASVPEGSVVVDGSALLHGEIAISEAVKADPHLSAPLTPSPAVPPVDGRALVVRSRSRKGFRRAGFAFTPEPRTISAKFLSGTEHDAIVNDPNLIVEIVVVDDRPVSAE